jgi:hypothetical protein
MEKSFEWVISAITTSTNQFHIEGCKKLIELFATKYSLEDGFAGAYIDLTNGLINKITFLNIEV